MIRGILFDLDGVLADTERLQWAAYRRVLSEFGIDVGLEEYRIHWIATGNGSEYACQTYNLPLSPAELKSRKARAYFELMAEQVAPRDGAAAALARLRTTHRLAVATNSPRAEVDLILARLGMVSMLDATVAREDYVRAKPAPDAYLAAASVLGLTPPECVVIEDTAVGASAGVAAGMRVIAAPHDLTFDNDFTACVHRLAHLDELTSELLATLG